MKWGDHLSPSSKNHMVPMVGGPMCGESAAINGVRLPVRLPMFHDGTFYFYELRMSQGEDFAEVFYEFLGDTQKPDREKKL